MSEFKPDFIPPLATKIVETLQSYDNHGATKAWFETEVARLIDSHIKHLYPEPTRIAHVDGCPRCYSGRVPNSQQFRPTEANSAQHAAEIFAKRYAQAFFTRKYATVMSVRHVSGDQYQVTISGKTKASQMTVAFIVKPL